MPGVGSLVGGGSSGRIAACIETTWGTNPGAGFVQTRFTSDTLEQATKTETSKEIRNDRQTPDLIRVDVTAQGDINFEFSHASFDDYIQCAMMSTWSTLIALTAQAIDISGASGQTATLTDAATSGAFTNAVKGQWLKIGGFTNPADNGYVRITTKTSNNVVIVSGLTFVNEAGQMDITISGRMIRIGTTPQSMTLERQATDIANVYDLFTGMRVGTFGLNIKPGSIVTGKVGFKGQYQKVFATSQVGSITAPNTNFVCNAIDNIRSFRESDLSVDSTLLLTDLSFDLNNGLRDLPAIGFLGNVQIGIGTALATGTLTAYLQDKSLIDEYVNFTATPLSFRVVDTNGHGYIVTFGRVKYSKGTNEIKGINTDRLASMGWTAFIDDDSHSMQIDEFSS